MIFHVKDVDKFWTYLKEKGFNPDKPRDAPWGERYVQLRDSEKAVPSTEDVGAGEEVYGAMAVTVILNGK